MTDGTVPSTGRVLTVVGFLTVGTIIIAGIFAGSFVLGLSGQPAPGPETSWNVTVTEDDDQVVVVAEHRGGDQVMTDSGQLQVTPTPDVTASGANGTVTPEGDYRGDERLTAGDTFALRYDRETIEGKELVVEYQREDGETVILFVSET